MPNSFLPPIEQGTAVTKKGVILIGDSWNMRHPLTGGGMTVALNDVVVLRDLLGSVDDLKDWKQMRKVLHRWHWNRKPLASTVNILSVALYDLFGADGRVFFKKKNLFFPTRCSLFFSLDEELQVLRTGCFKYFERGGECVNGPVSLLSGFVLFAIILVLILNVDSRSCSIIPSRCLLAYHFFSVAFYSIWIMFTHPRTIPSSPNGHSNGNAKPHSTKPQFSQYPALLKKSIRVVGLSISEYYPFSEIFVSSSGQLVWCSVLYYGRKYVRLQLRIGQRIN